MFMPIDRCRWGKAVPESCQSIACKCTRLVFLIFQSKDAISTHHFLPLLGNSLSTMQHPSNMVGGSWEPNLNMGWCVMTRLHENISFILTTGRAEEISYFFSGISSLL